MKKCLNCEAESDSKFCPVCGQAMDTQRFTMRSFGVHLVASLSRVSGSFLRTAWLLLARPWTVIRDYVYGKRVGLVSPVAMLLLLALYWGVFMAIVPKNPAVQTGISFDGSRFGALMKWLYGSLTFQYLFLAIPVAFGTWIVYRRDMRGRFNFAELLIATLYMACTFLLVDFILSPVELLNETAGVILVCVATAIYGIIAIIKAFPQPAKARTFGKLALWCLICGVFLSVFLILFAVPMICKSLSSCYDFQ